MSIPGPPHSEPPRCPGQTSHVAGSVEQRSCSEWKIPRAPSSLSTARSGRAMSPTNSVSPVSTAHGSGAARGVDERERGVLGAVAGRVQRAHAQRAELELPAVVERLVLVVGLGDAVDVDRRAGRRGQPAVAGDVVGVVVGLEDVLDRARRGSARARRYSSISSRGSTTAATPASSSPIRYEAQPRSSWVIWRKSIDPTSSITRFRVVP